MAKEDEPSDLNEAKEAKAVRVVRMIHLTPQREYEMQSKAYRLGKGPKPDEALRRLDERLTMYAREPAVEEHAGVLLGREEEDEAMEEASLSEKDEPSEQEASDNEPSDVFSRLKLGSS